MRREGNQLHLKNVKKSASRIVTKAHDADPDRNTHVDDLRRPTGHHPTIPIVIRRSHRVAKLRDASLHNTLTSLRCDSRFEV